MRRHKLVRSRRNVISALAVLGLVGALAGPAAAEPASPAIEKPVAAAPSAGSLDNVLGTYGFTVKETTPRSDGQIHTDTPATISALERLHVNTYAYEVYNATSWEDFVNEFMPAAQAAGIAVWVYLLPKTEVGSPPYGTDFVTWGKTIANLSLQYPELDAWAIDDFLVGGNPAQLTPSYMATVKAAVDAVNPRVKFFATVYYEQYTAKFYADYGNTIDGTIFPYANYPYIDTTYYSSLQPELDTVSALAKAAGKRLYLMPYAMGASQSPFLPSASYVKAVDQIGEQNIRSGEIDGVVNYLTPLAPKVETCQPQIGSIEMLIYPLYHATSVPGGSESVSETVTVTPGVSSYALDFWQKDTVAAYYPPNDKYFQKQVLVDGQVVWSLGYTENDDLAGLFVHEHLDLTPYLTGKTTATITFRLINPTLVYSGGVTFMISQPVGTGFTVPDFSVGGSWPATSTAHDFTNAVIASYPCDPNRQQDVFDAVADAYSSYSLVILANRVTGVPEEKKEVLVRLASQAMELHDNGQLRAAVAVTEALSQNAAHLGQQQLAAQADSVADQIAATITLNPSTGS